MSLEKEIKELRELADNHLADKKELEEVVQGYIASTNEYIKEKDKKIELLEKKNRTLSFKLENIVKVAKEKDELRIMNLAGISTISICNTEKSLKEQGIDKDNPYWTVAFEDVRTAMLREIKLLKAIKEKEEKLSKAIECIKNSPCDAEEGNTAGGTVMFHRSDCGRCKTLKELEGEK